MKKYIKPIATIIIAITTIVLLAIQIYNGEITLNQATPTIIDKAEVIDNSFNELFGGDKEAQTGTLNELQK